MPRRALLFALVLLPACAGSNPPSDRPQPAHAAPANLSPTRLAPALLTVADTNRNRRPDMLVVVVYLFAPQASPLPFHAQGQMVFTLVGEENQAIATWTFPKDEAAARADSDAIGPRYTFALDLRAAAGTDEFPPQTAVIAASFIRPDGVTINAVDPVAVRLGLP